MGRRLLVKLGRSLGRDAQHADAARFGRLEDLGPLGGRFGEHRHQRHRRQEGRHILVRRRQRRTLQPLAQPLDRPDQERMGHVDPRGQALGRRLHPGHELRGLQLVREHLEAHQRPAPALAHGIRRPPEARTAQRPERRSDDRRVAEGQELHGREGHVPIQRQLRFRQERQAALLELQRVPQTPDLAQPPVADRLQVVALDGPLHVDRTRLGILGTGPHVGRPQRLEGHELRYPEHHVPQPRRHVRLRQDPGAQRRQHRRLAHGDVEEQQQPHVVRPALDLHQPDHPVARALGRCRCPLLHR